MKLSHILKKENNNFDLFRIIASCMVIYGHAYVLSPQIGKHDIISRFISSDYSGSLAVKIFFFLSGLLVTNSLINNDNLIRFALSRFFRIWPALIVSSIITSIFIGPLLTALSIQDYFSQKEVFTYILNISRLNIIYNLPGVFTHNAYANAVNGSLWTIPFEVLAYAVLFCFSAIGLIKKNKICSILFFLIIVEPFFSSKYIFSWVSTASEVNFILPCFAFGSILALNKENIEINLSKCLGLLILAYIFRANLYSIYLLYAFVFIFILYLSSTSILLKLKPKADISYGIYLYGFVVQQTISQYFLSKGVLYNQIFSLIISIIFGFLSWHLCEKYFIKIGNSLSKTLNSFFYKE